MPTLRPKQRRQKPIPLRKLLHKLKRMLLLLQQEAQQQAAQDQAAAAAQAGFEQAGAYQVSTTESDPVNTQETAAKTDKKKPKSTLKIGQNTVAATAGTGLNIGT